MPSSFRPWPYSKLAFYKTHRDINSAASSTPLFIFIPPHEMLSHNHTPPTRSACLLGNYVHTEVTMFCPCYSKCGRRSSNINITWGLIRHKELMSHPRPTESVCRWFIDMLKFEKHCSIPWDSISLAKTDLYQGWVPKPKTCTHWLASSLWGGWHELCVAGCWL